MKKPIMSEDVENAVLDALAQFEKKFLWEKWGMHLIREQGAAILLHGPPGTGKSVIARWMAARRGRGCLEFNIAALTGNGTPGSIEKNVRDFYDDARRRKNATIFMDECNGLLIDRRGDVEASWQPTTTEEVMVNMSKYPGLQICATNYIDKLDEALDQRFLAIIEVKRPAVAERLRIWKQKWPITFPLQPTEREVAQLAGFDLNGRQIETVLINAASRAMRKGVKPKMEHFIMFAEQETHKHIKHEN